MGGSVGLVWQSPARVGIGQSRSDGGCLAPVPGCTQDPLGTCPMVREARCISFTDEPQNSWVPGKRQKEKHSLRKRMGPPTVSISHEWKSLQVRGEICAGEEARHGP